MLSGDNGLLNRAGQARDDTLVGEERENVEMAYISAAMKNLGGNVTQTDLQNELDAMFGDTEKSEANKRTKVTGSSTFNVHYNDTNHNYTVNSGTVTRVADGEQNTPSDLEKLQLYCRTKLWSDFLNYDSNTYVYSFKEGIEPIVDANTSITFGGWGTNALYIEYNNENYVINFDSEWYVTTVAFSKPVFFLAGGSVCEFEKEMNWSNFINSSYNSLGFSVITYGTQTRIPAQFRGKTLISLEYWPLEDGNGNGQTGDILIKKFEIYGTAAW